MWLNSSSAAISTMRWPSAGSSPVVSVSTTISRMARTVSGFAATQILDDALEAPEGLGAAEPARHNIVGLAPPQRIGHLLGEDRSEQRLGHAGPGQHAAALDEGRCRDCDHPVDATRAAGLVQKRNVEHRDRCALDALLPQKRGLVAPHQRVKDF